MAKTATRTKTTSSGIQFVETSTGMTWVNISAPSTKTLAQLKERFPQFLDMDIENCLPPFQRPKLLERDDYLFMVLLFPTYSEKSRKVVPTEVDFFVGRDFVVTSHDKNVPGLMELAQTCSIDDEACRRDMGDNPAKALYTVLHNLLSGVFPLLTTLSNQIIEAEQDVLEKEGDYDTVRDILRIKSNIVQCRQAMQGHKLVIRKFIERAEKFFDTDELQVFYEDLVGHTKEIWDYLENDKETINAIYDSQLSMVTYNTNDAMKKLAALALMVFPTTLIAAIFAMDADHMPIRGLYGDFWIMLGFVGTMALSTLTYLRYKNWL